MCVRGPLWAETPETIHSTFVSIIDTPYKIERKKKPNFSHWADLAPYHTASIMSSARPS